MLQQVGDNSKQPSSDSMIVIFMGVAGSGKTTVGERLAKELGWQFYDGDQFHPPANIAKMRRGEPLDDADRAGWLMALRNLIDTLIAAGKSGVIACSALKQVYREQLLANDRIVKFIYLKGSYEAIHKRMATRQGHYFKTELLASQFAVLEEPTNAIVVDASLPANETVTLIRRTLAN